MSLKHLIAVAAVGIAAIAAPLAQAHAKLEASQPQAGSELAVAPHQIRLQFNEKLEPAFSKIELIGANSAPLALPKIAVDPATPGVMTCALPPLTSGRYVVRWSAMTFDGHKVKGQFDFKVN
jgi:methionine-rich copper-binding protein CopC